MRSRSLLGTAVVLAVAGSLAAVGGSAAAEEVVFADDFELGDVCGWTAAAPPLATIAESEPNDEIATADPLPRCGTIEGAIGAIVAGEADFDLYEVVVDGPTLLRFTLAERDGASDFEPYVDVDDAAQEPPWLGIAPIASAGSTTRQIWLPAAGSWYLFVTDQRNWDRQLGLPVEPPVAGGPTCTYRLSVGVEPVEPVPVFFQLQDEPLAIGAEGSLVIYRLAAGQTASLTYAEVAAARLGSPSPLDAKLHLVREAATGRSTVRSCDDWFVDDDCVDGGDEEIETVDPRIPDAAEVDVPLDPGDPYLIVVDFFDVYDPVSGEPETLPAPFELDLQYLETPGLPAVPSPSP